ncbi:MAG: hypothetical protein MK135_04220, partial [Polyangiaceae bacterium]|nr:hypothetical protein [Polyangiaceae bacterium]
YEVIGAPAFGLLSCLSPGKPQQLLLVTVDDPEKLPNRKELQRDQKLRRAIADAASLGPRRNA